MKLFLKKKNHREVKFFKNINIIQAHPQIILYIIIY